MMQELETKIYFYCFYMTYYYCSSFQTVLLLYCVVNLSFLFSPLTGVYVRVKICFVT